jgi:hypothetical protein
MLIPLKYSSLINFLFSDLLSFYDSEILGREEIIIFTCKNYTMKELLSEFSIFALMNILMQI